MLLALLMLVLGREGGPGLARPGAKGLEAGPSLSEGTPGVLAREGMPPMGGGMEELRGGREVGGRRPEDPGGPWDGGGTPPEALRAAAAGGPPRGGGGVADGLAESVALPAFLLIHFFSSGS